MDFKIYRTEHIFIRLGIILPIYKHITRFVGLLSFNKDIPVAHIKLKKKKGFKLN